MEPESREVVKRLLWSQSLGRLCRGCCGARVSGGCVEVVVEPESREVV